MTPPPGGRGKRPHGPGRDRGAGARGPVAAKSPRATPAGSTRWTRWVAYALILAYAIYWAVQAFTVHRMGNYAVETDFYWKYGPAARDLTLGKVDIANYDSKGWGYPAVVAFLSFFGFETFRAGQIVALLSAALSLLLAYRLHRSLFGPVAALAGVLFLIGNGVFLANTYEVGTDLFFLAVSLGSVALLLRSRAPGWRAIVASGLLGGWAFSTRYNGLVLWPGALALFFLLRVPAGPLPVQARRAALWTAGFIVAALPWLWINAAHTGNPLTNSNYVNVGYSVYGEGNWEKFFYGERTIRSLADVVLLDPGRFAGAMARNFVEHLRRDLLELMSPPWGILAVIGGFLMLRDRPERRVGGYLFFGALGFLSLVPVFYGTRFSLPLLPFYAALVTWPLVSPTLGRALAGLERVFPLRAFAFLALWLPITVGAYSWTSDDRNSESVENHPRELVNAVAFLKEQPPGGVLARKPHAAFLARMPFVPLPNAPSLDSLRSFAGRSNARYLLITGMEFNTRPVVQPLAADTTIAGFRRIFLDSEALLFEVLR